MLTVQKALMKFALAGHSVTKLQLIEKYFQAGVIKYGACDILISPVTEKDLLDKLQKHLFNKQD